MGCTVPLSHHNAITAFGQPMFESLDALRSLGHAGAPKTGEAMPSLPPRFGVSDRRRSRPAR